MVHLTYTDNIFFDTHKEYLTTEQYRLYIRFALMDLITIHFVDRHEKPQSFS